MKVLGSAEVIHWETDSSVIMLCFSNNFIVLVFTLERKVCPPEVSPSLSSFLVMGAVGGSVLYSWMVKSCRMSRHDSSAPDSHWLPNISIL